MAITCYLLSPRGFCSGVTRAINMADQVLKLYNSAYIIEDIIHNKIFMKEIEKRGIIKVSSIDEIPNDSVVMFSAHGVSPEVIAKAEKKRLTIIDGTCPIVKEIQKAVTKASEEGKKIIVIGNRAHPEITALLGYANNEKVFVVSNEMDVDLLPDFTGEEVMYFTQTTLDYYSIQNVIAHLRKKVPHIKSDSEDNICYATKERQRVVKEIANETDLIIVVGSSYSSNSTRLAEIAQEFGVKKVVQIDDKNDLNLKIFDKVQKCAITSGASVPETIINDLKDFLQSNLDILFEEYVIS
ncbi:MAG: 4-hydroxy-3-methylbut-2-enyl diphosphate reductase [Holosporales bacterium]|nr:4-hydroxy-3-methylbut-2-enyl diphosphate reductase [Holosporales bacterium]